MKVKNTGPVRAQWARLAFIARSLREGLYQRKDLQREFEICKRTATRDLNILRDDLGWNVIYNSALRGFVLKSHPPKSL